MHYEMVNIFFFICVIRSGWSFFQDGSRVIKMCSDSHLLLCLHVTVGVLFCLGLSETKCMAQVQKEKSLTKYMAAILIFK